MNKLSRPDAGRRMILLGNEAIARGALEAGVQLVAAYPGTPSSEVVETLLECARDLGFYAEWSVNEKVAFEVAAGSAVIGSRSLTALKGAGLNVIMDMFLTLPYTGTRGGLVVVVADDPGAHYSSNEQDSRVAVQWANLPCLEPEDQHEAKEMTRAAFELSERLEQPVIVRTVTRLSHSSGIVEIGPVANGKLAPGFNKHWKIPYRWNVYGPPGAEEKHKWQLDRSSRMKAESDRSPFNSLQKGREPVAIVASGMGMAYAREALRDLGLEDRVWLCKIGMPYPVPENLLGEVVENCRKVLVVEEGDPFVETQLRVLAGARQGKAAVLGKIFDGVLPLFGELNTDKVASALASLLDIHLAANHDRVQAKAEASAKIPPRSSTLCAGCPHLGTYWAINRVVKADKKHFPVINGDIGCYEQAGYGIKGQMPTPSDEDAARYISKTPYDLLDTLYVMGSGISMAQGQARGGLPQGRFLAVAGDSTFFHSCMPGLLNAVWNGTKIAFVVMDNSWTAMTGHQACPATGMTSLGAPAKVIKAEEVARSLGVEMVEVTDPYRLDDVIAAVRKALDFEGVAVVVSRGECILQVNRRSEKSKVRTVVTDDCTGCKVCTEIGCPAIAFQGGRANIDDLLCVSCGICSQACPENAILERRMAKQE